MARIKCEYYRSVCKQMWKPGDPFRECYEHFSEYGQNCDQFMRREPAPNIIGDYTCFFHSWERVRFEKETKNYELDENFLTIGKRQINRFDMSYLEIDGEVIIQEEDK